MAFRRQETSAELASAIQSISQSTKELDPAAQVAALNTLLSPPDTATTNTVWLVVVSGFIGLLVVGLVGIIVLLADGKTTDVALTAFTALLTGLIGLFSPSPVKSAGGRSDE